MRLLQLSLLPLLGSTVPSSAHPSQPDEQKVINRYRTDASRADAIKEAFRHSWDSYYKYAFPHDSLKPLDKSFADDR